MRIRALLFLIVCAVMLGGCASVHTIDMQTANEDTFYELNALARRQTARLMLDGWPPLTATDLQISPDSTSWRNPRSGRVQHVPTSEVREIRFRKNRLWKGAGVGAGFGVGLALAVGQDCGGKGPEEACISRWDLVPAGLLIGGILGGVIGTRGEERFVLTPPRRQPAVQ